MLTLNCSRAAAGKLTELMLTLAHMPSQSMAGQLRICCSHGAAAMELQHSNMGTLVVGDQQLCPPCASQDSVLTELVQAESWGSRRRRTPRLQRRD